MEEERAESRMTLSQWLHPSRIPRSYTALLIGDPALVEDDALWDVEETIDLPTGGRDVARKAQKVHSDRADGGSICPGETSTNAFVHKFTCKMKPSERIESCGNHESSENCAKSLLKNRSVDSLTHPWSQREKLTIQNGEQSDKDNRDSSQLYCKHRVGRSKQSNTNRQRSYSSERERKLRIANNIKALQELLPSPVEDTPESTLNDTVAHVKLLQLQVKELSRSRLAGEPASHPFVSIEGYGHYIHEQQKMNKPLEDIMAKLLETDPEAAHCLLESKGLYLMPMGLAEGVH